MATVKVHILNIHGDVLPVIFIMIATTYSIIGKSTEVIVFSWA